MAEIVVPSKCSVCGEAIKPDDKAVLISIVKTKRYYSWGDVGGEIGINFYSGSPRVLQHYPQCPGTEPVAQPAKAREPK